MVFILHIEQSVGQELKENVGKTLVFSVWGEEIWCDGRSV